MKFMRTTLNFTVYCILLLLIYQHHWQTHTHIRTFIYTLFYFITRMGNGALVIFVVVLNLNLLDDIKDKKTYFTFVSIIFPFFLNFRQSFVHFADWFYMVEWFSDSATSHSPANIAWRVMMRYYAQKKMMLTYGRVSNHIPNIYEMNFKLNSDSIFMR